MAVFDLPFSTRRLCNFGPNPSPFAAGRQVKNELYGNSGLRKNPAASRPEVSTYFLCAEPHLRDDKWLVDLLAPAEKKEILHNPERRHGFHQCFTCATRPHRHRLPDGLCRHAVRRTRIYPIPARTLASGPDPYARTRQRPLRFARGAA
jgi:hypothetical protein